MAAPMSLCRLCITTCNDDFKSLYDENGQANGLYELTYDYFHPKIVDLEKAKHLTAICLECFRHIHDFHSFQTSVTIAQLELIAEDKTIYITAEETETPQCESLTQAMAIKVEEEEFIGFSPAYAVEKDCQQIMPKEFITLSDIQIDDSSASTIMNNHQIIETLSIKGGANDEEDRKDHISLPPLEIMDVDTGSTFSSDDEIPLAQLDVINSSATKTRSSDGGVTQKFDNPKPSDAQPQKKYETLKNLLAIWIPHKKCFKCKKSFPSWPHLKDHFKQRHPNEIFHYICCSRKFNRIQIRDHLLLHDDPKVFMCSICHKRYSSSSSISTHYSETHAENLKFPCDKCNKRCITKSGLAKHYRNLHSSSPRKDRLDLQMQHSPPPTNTGDTETKDQQDNISQSEVPSAQDDDINSSVTKTSNEKSKSSDQPQMKYETFDNLLAKWIPNIKCFKCSTAFPSWSILKGHFKSQHPDEKFYYICCSLKLNRYQIKDHLCLHNDYDAFKCSLCGKRYETSGGLSSHYNVRHRECLKFPCDKCRKRFISNSSLEMHLRIEHRSYRHYLPDPQPMREDNNETTVVFPDKDREDHISSLPPLEIMDADAGDKIPLSQVDARNPNADFTGTIDNQKSSCDQPQKIYEALEHLLAKWIPNIKCFKCSRSFLSWSLVKDHFKRQHPNEEFYYICCSRKFYKRAIKDHLILHSDPDAYKCSICGNNYYTTKNLTAHNATMHTERLKFSCDKCGKRFCSNLGLIRHLSQIHYSLRQDHANIELLANDDCPTTSGKSIDSVVSTEKEDAVEDSPSITVVNAAADRQDVAMSKKNDVNTDCEFSCDREIEQKIASSSVSIKNDDCGKECF